MTVGSAESYIIGQEQSKAKSNAEHVLVCMGFAPAAFSLLPFFLQHENYVHQLDNGRICNIGNWVNHCVITRKQAINYVPVQCCTLPLCLVDLFTEGVLSVVCFRELCL